MMAVVGRMPLWAGENQDIYLAKSADVVDGVVVVETAMVSDGKRYEYRAKGLKGEGAEPRPKGLKGGGADETEGAEPKGLKINPDGAE